MEILYEDKEFIVCIKPCGISSQKDKSGSSDNMVDILQKYINDNGEKGEICVVHRLDKNVGGVMVYAKNNSSAAYLSKLIQDRKFTKEYYAVIKGCPLEKTGVMEDLLFKDSSKNKSFVVKRIRKGVKKASLEYECMATSEVNGVQISLIRIKLHTGRTHQIRVQFASRKMPLLGDGKYGSRDNKCEVALWSHKIGFEHNITHEYIEFECGVPEEYPFIEFDL